MFTDPFQVVKLEVDAEESRNQLNLTWMRLERTALVGTAIQANMINMWLQVWGRLAPQMVLAPGIIFSLSNVPYVNLV